MVSGREAVLRRVEWFGVLFCLRAKNNSLHSVISQHVRTTYEAVDSYCLFGPRFF